MVPPPVSVKRRIEEQDHVTRVGSANDTVLSIRVPADVPFAKYEGVFAALGKRFQRETR